MRTVKKVPDNEEAKARARLLTHFIDNSEQVFYSRQLEILFENGFFHWVTNRALRSLIEEKHVLMETRKLDIGSEMKLEKDGRGYGIEVRTPWGIWMWMSS
jgi:hypothetical protein